MIMRKVNVVLMVLSGRFTRPEARYRHRPWSLCGREEFEPGVYVFWVT